MPSHRRDVALLFGALGAFFLSVSMMIPTLPLYIRDLGGSPIEVGVVIGAFSVGVLLARPFAGHAVDARGRRPTMILGSIVAALMAPLYLFTAFAALVAVRLVHGAGLSAFTSASTTMVADLAPPERRTAFLGWLSTSSIVAFAIGPVIGLEIMRRLGWMALFAAIAVTAAASAACGAGLSRPPRRRHSEERIDYRRTLLRRAVLAPTATMLLVTVAHGGAFAFVPILLESRLDFNFGFFFLVYAGASLVVRMAAGPISRGLGDGPMIWGGLALYGGGMALLPLVGGGPSMAAAAVLMGTGFGIFQPAIYAVVANAASDRTRGMVFSVFLGAFDFGMGFGGLVAGPVVAAYGIPALLRWLAFVPLAAAALFVAWLGWRPSVALSPDAEIAIEAGAR